MGILKRYLNEREMEGRVYMFDLSNPPGSDLKKQICELYAKKFKRKCDVKDIDGRLEDGDKYIVFLSKQGKLLSFLRWHMYSTIINKKKKEMTKKYLNLFNVKDLVFIGEVASDYPGAGKFLIDYLKLLHYVLRNIRI